MTGKSASSTHVGVSQVIAVQVAMNSRFDKVEVSEIRIFRDEPLDDVRERRDRVLHAHTCTDAV